MVATSYTQQHLISKNPHDQWQNDFPMACKKTDIFSKIEEKLYQIFPSLKEGNNIFLCNGRKIENSQSILSNEITHDSIILINSEF